MEDAITITPNRTGARKKINVVFFTSYRIMLDSLTLLFESTEEIKIAAGVTKINELKPIVEKTQPDVVVICLMENESAGIEVMTEIQRTCPAVKFLIFTCSDDITEHLKAVQLGAFGLVTKDQSGRTLIRAIRQIYEGETWFNQKLISRILNDDGRNLVAANTNSANVQLESITKRELEVIKFVARGLKNKEIGRELFISEATVRHHLSSIYGKIGVTDRLNLVIYAYQNKIINFDQNNSH